MEQFMAMRLYKNSQASVSDYMGDGEVWIVAWCGVASPLIYAVEDDAGTPNAVVRAVIEEEPW